eukprot:6185414-Pleurochrysis_carterae.AAC.3
MDAARQICPLSSIRGACAEVRLPTGARRQAQRRPHRPALCDRAHTQGERRGTIATYAGPVKDQRRQAYLVRSS